MIKHSPRRVWERMRTVPGLGRDVAALALVVAVGLVAGGYMISHYGVRWPGQQSFTFAADFESAPGVTATNHQEVRIAGVPVGTIIGAQPNKDGTAARLTMRIDPRHPIYRNAHLVLRTKNPINEMYVEINPGGPPAPPLSTGNVVPVAQTERPVQSYEVLDKLDARTRAAMSSLLDESDTGLASAPANLPGGLRTFDQALVDYKPVMDALATRRDKIQQLVTALSEISTAAGHNDARLTELVSSLQSTLSVLANRSDNLNAALVQLPGFENQLQTAMSSTTALTGQLNPTLDDLHQASGTLPPALNQLSTTVDQLGRTVRQATPLVGKAGPVVTQLRPVVADAQAALDDLRPVTAQLNDVTARVVPWMTDLSAFVYNTSSVFALSDANGTLARGHLAVNPLNPTGGAPAPTGGNK